MLNYPRRLGFLLLLSLLFSVCAYSNAQTKSAKTIQPNPPATIEEVLPSGIAAVLIADGLGELLSSFDNLVAVKALEGRIGQAELRDGASPLLPLRHYLTLGISNPKAVDLVRTGIIALPINAALSRTPAGRQKAAQASTENIYFIESHDAAALNLARTELLLWADIGAVDKTRESTKFENLKAEFFKGGSVGVWVGNLYLVGKPEAVRKLIDTWQHSGSEKLTDEPKFLKAQLSRKNSASVWAYVNGAALSNLVPGAQVATVGNLAELGNFTGNSLEAIVASSYQLRFNSGTVDEALSVYLRPGSSGFLKNIFSGPAIQFSGPSFLPDSATVVTSLSVDWKKFYELVFLDMFYARYPVTGGPRSNPQQRPTEAEIRSNALLEEKRTNRELGFDLKEELEKSFQNEITFAYGLPEGREEVESSSPGRKDGFAILFKCRDRETARATILKFISYQMEGIGDARNNPEGQSDEAVRKRRQEREASLAEDLKTLQKEYRGSSLVDARIFSLAFSDEFVIIGSSLNSVRSVIDRLTDPDNSQSGRTSHISGEGPGSFRFYLSSKYADSALNRLVRQSVGSSAELPEDLSSLSPLNTQFSVSAGGELQGDVLSLNAKSVLGVFGLFWAASNGTEAAQLASRAENDAKYVLRQISSAEKAYFDKHGHYTDAGGLSAAKVTTFDFKRLESETTGYKFELKIGSGKSFSATATPIDYGRRGRISLYIDENGEMRGGDLKGLKAGSGDDLISSDNRNEN